MDRTFILLTILLCATGCRKNDSDTVSPVIIGVARDMVSDTAMPNMTVYLSRYNYDNVLLERFETTTNSEGKFFFLGLELKNKLFYVIHADGPNSHYTPPEKQFAEPVYFNTEAVPEFVTLNLKPLFAELKVTFKFNNPSASAQSAEAHFIRQGQAAAQYKFQHNSPAQQKVSRGQMGTYFVDLHRWLGGQLTVKRIDTVNMKWKESRSVEVVAD